MGKSQFMRLQMPEKESYLQNNYTNKITMGKYGGAFSVGKEIIPLYGLKNVGGTL